MESILTSVKKLLGIGAEYEVYDPDIIIHINSVFMTLRQLGVGPAEGFFIEDETAVWTDFVEDVSKLQAIKTYIFLKVKILFDPNSIGASTLAAYERTIQELEWRLNVDAETEVSYEPNSNIDHTHNNKVVLDSYNKSQSELLNAAKLEAEKLVTDLKTIVDNALENKVDKNMEMSADDVNDLFQKT